MDSWHNNLLSSANKGKIDLIQAINISEDVTAYSTNKAVEEFPSHSFKNKNSDKPILKSLLEPKNIIEPIKKVFSYNVEYEI